MTIDITPPTAYKPDAGTCNDCGDHTAWELDGKLLQPCPKCATKIANDKVHAEIKETRINSYRYIMDSNAVTYDWDIFKGCDAEQKECVKAVYNWQQNFTIGKWLVMKGRQGTGKSLMKNLLIKHLIKNDICSVKNTTGQEMFDEYDDVLKNKESKKSLKQQYYKYDCLMIDEVGKHSSADGFRNYLNEIIDVFYKENKTIIVISNFDLERKVVGGAKHISDFIDVDRINEKALVVDFNFESYRGRK